MALSTEPLIPPPPGVGRTSIGVARIRAGDSRRPDRLFDDPFAQAFVDAAPGVLPAITEGDERTARLLRCVTFFTVIRTRFFDDHLAGAVRAGCRQVVLVAAGLDTRAYRMDWPAGLRLFELDLPEVLAFKQGVLDAVGSRPRCARTAIGTDLLGDWPPALLGAGLHPDEPVARLVEGLLIYLDAEEAARLLAAITRLSPPGSRLSCELQAPADPDRGRARLGGYTDLWKGGLRAQLPEHLRAAGWAVDVHDRSAVAACYGRSGPPAAGAGFVVATRTAS